MKIDIRLDGIDALDPALDAHLPLQVVPEKDQGRPGILVKLAPLRLS